MVRRSRRGQPAEEARQDEPEAILRNSRRAARCARDERAHCSIGGLSLPQNQEAAQAQVNEDPMNEGNNTGAQGTERQQAVSSDGRLAATSSQGAAPRSTTGNEHRQSFQENASNGQQAPSPGSEKVARRTDDDHDRTSAAQATIARNVNGEGSRSTGQDAGSDTGPEGPNENEKKDMRSDLATERIRTGDGDSAGDSSGRIDERMPLTAYQQFRANLEAFVREAAGRNVPTLSGDNTFQAGQYLTDNVLHQAIASVTEAISRKGTIHFSLVNEVSESTARPGQTLLWPFHRIRTNGGGHFSLFIVQPNASGGWPTEHRDSYEPMRNNQTMREHWQTVRQLLQRAGWHAPGDAEHDALSTEVEVPTQQYNQNQHWSCGVFTIINAWIHALGLPRSRVEDQSMQAEFTEVACEVIRLAMRGCMDSATIRNFLECYEYIDAGAQSDPGRTFERTVAFPTAMALQRHTALERLEWELAPHRSQSDEMMVPHVGEMLGTFEDDNPERWSSGAELIREYYRLWRTGLELPLTFRLDGDALDDDAVALRTQQEEFARELTPGQPNTAGGNKSVKNESAPQQTNAQAQEEEGPEQGLAGRAHQEQADHEAAQRLQEQLDRGRIPNHLDEYFKSPAATDVPRAHHPAPPPPGQPAIPGLLSTIPAVANAGEQQERPQPDQLEHEREYFARRTQTLREWDRERRGMEEEKEVRRDDEDAERGLAGEEEGADEGVDERRRRSGTSSAGIPELELEKGTRVVRAEEDFSDTELFGRDPSEDGQDGDEGSGV